jgi:AraC family transcriptional regulator
MSALFKPSPAAAPWQGFASSRVRTVRYRPGIEQTRHRHAEAGLSLVLAGELQESGPGGTVVAAAGSLVVKPAGCWHSNRYGPTGAVLLQIAPRPDRAEPWIASHWQYRWLNGARLARAMLALMAGESNAEENSELAFWEAMSWAVPRQSLSKPLWWPRALELIDESILARVSIADISRQVDVHPVHLARVCRREMGCSLRQYLLERRTLLAWRTCMTGEQPLSAIAAEFGFADQAHMTRTFTTKLGVSPAKLRRLAAGWN